MEDIIERLKKYIDVNIEKLKNNDKLLKMADKVVELNHTGHKQDALSLMFSVENGIIEDVTFVDLYPAVLYDATEYINGLDSEAVKKKNIESILLEIGYAESTVRGTVRKFGEGLDKGSKDYEKDLLSNIGKSRSKYAKNARAYMDKNYN